MKKNSAGGPAYALITLFLALTVNPLAAQTNSGPAETGFDRTVIHSVISGQINAFRSGNHDKAYSYAAPKIKSMFGSVDQFISMVKKAYLPVYAPRTYTFGDARSTRNEVVQQVFVTGPKGKGWIALYTLERQPAGDWKISGCYLQRDDGQGA